jgi:DNA-binding transcriptional MerR regulator
MVMAEKRRKQNVAFEIPVKLYRIGEIVRYTPFTRQTIHNYTTMGLIQESSWTQGGHRLYDESVFHRLATITELRKTNTLAQIRKMMKTKTTARPKASTASAS